MPTMGWPEALPVGTRFRLKGVEYRFVGPARFVTVDAQPVPKPAYQGLAVPTDGPGQATVKTVPAGDVALV